MFCPNCGAAYDENEAACPYCGTINPRGAQKEYMRKLRGINDKTGELAKEAEEEVRKETRRNSRWLVRRVLIAAALVLAVFGVVKLMEDREERRSIARYREQAAFEQQYFPELNRLYEEGKGDELLAFLKDHEEDPGFGAVYSWRHYEYCMRLDAYRRLKELWDEIRAGDDSRDTLTLAVYDALYLTRIEEWEDTLTEADRESLREAEAFAEEILEEVLKTDAAGVDAFYRSVQGKYGVLEYDRLKKAVRALP